MATLKIWYSYHHDDATVAEIVLKKMKPEDYVTGIIQQGGLWLTEKDSDAARFVFLHRINDIEVTPGE